MIPERPSTSQIAAAKAAPRVGSWRARILDWLRARPSTLWEVANHFEVPDHAISGRFTELARDLWIEHTGERREHPISKCPAEVWRVRADSPTSSSSAGLDKLGYPPTLRIGAELYDRQELLPSEGYPGIPYARRADTGGVRQMVRVALVECEGCGRPLYQVEDRDARQSGKQYRCGNHNCGRTFRPQLVQESGRGAMLAMVMERF